MEQKYFCEECGLKNSISYEEHADVYSVIDAIRDDHRKRSPQCEALLSRIRRIKEDVTLEADREMLGDEADYFEAAGISDIGNK